MTRHSDDPSIETRAMVANGLTFEVDMCGTGDRLALLLHGFPELAYSWRHQLPLLARLGYRVWAPNLRGYGRSSRPPRIADYAMSHLIADVAGLIERADARSVTLIGHDWGGAIAWAYAIRYAPTLERLVVMNMPHPALFFAAIHRMPQALRSWYIPALQLPWLPELALGACDEWLLGKIFTWTAVDSTRFTPDVLRVYRQAARRPGALRSMVNYYRALRYAWPEKSQPASAPLGVPTLLIWGEEDVALDRTLTIGTDALVQDLVVRHLPGVSHWVQQEAPGTVNAILEAWLTDQPVPKPGARV